MHLMGNGSKMSKWVHRCELDGFGALTDLDLAVSSLTHPGLVLNDPGDELKQPYFHFENQ